MFSEPLHFAFFRGSLSIRIQALAGVLFLGISAAFSQTKISGTVKSKDGETLVGANISVSGSYDGSSSSPSGKFNFVTSEKGQHVLTVTMIGYEKYTATLPLNGVPILLNITMTEKSNELNTVQVTVGSFEAGDQKKGLMLSALDIATTAGSQADIFAALQTLPGTQPTSNTTGLFVRGGEASEAKTWFDGLLIKNPYFSDLPDIASRGRFSPFMFKGTNFSSGAYTTEFGQGLSSALQLESKDLPDKTSTDVSLMTVGAGATRTLRHKNSGLAAGYSYINLQPIFYLVPQRAHWTTPPRSQDGFLSYKLKMKHGGFFKGYVDYSYSQVGLSLPNMNDTSGTALGSFPLALLNHTRNLYFNATYQVYLRPQWRLQSGVSYSSDDVLGHFSAIGYGNLQQVSQGRLVSTHFFGRWSSLKWGLHEFEENFQTRFDSLKAGFSSYLHTGFTEGQIFFSRKLALRLGARYEYAGLQQRGWLTPRAALSYRLDKKSQLAMAYGKFNEQPEEVFLIHDKTLNAEKADHYLMNYQFMGNDRTVRLEAYYKKYSSLVKAPAFNATTPMAQVLPFNNGYAYGSPYESSYQGPLNNSGYGYARGLDFFLRDRRSIKGVDYWISYSFLDSKRDFRFFTGSAVPAFSARNTLNLVYKQFVNKIHTQLSGTFTYASGRSYYNPSSPVFYGDRTPDYKNLSVSVSYLTAIWKSFTVLYLSIGNVTGFKNIYGYHYANNGQTREAIGPPALRTVFVGLFLTFGDTRPLD